MGNVWTPTIGRRNLASKFAAAAMAGVLALGMAPVGSALAAQDGTLAAGGIAQVSTQHYDYQNNTGKALSDTLNGKVKRVDSTDDDHVYQYMGYVHSDGSHYSPYSLYTQITTDDSGIVTAIDLTSANDMWTGKWGNMTANIEGFLPDGVNFSARSNSDGTWSPVLNGTSAYDVSDPVITFISTNAAGTADAFGIDQSAGGERKAAASGGKGGKGGSPEPSPVPAIVSNSGTISDGKIAIPTSVSGVITSEQVTTDDEGSKSYAKNEDGTYVTGTANGDYYNLVKCEYTLNLKGNTLDKVTFNTYFTVGEYSEAADQYIDNVIGTTEWKDASYNQTNRDGWTGLTGTLALRMLGSWNAYLQDSSVSTDLDGQVASIDTVSGATKTSNVFVEALNQAKEDGFIKGVSENVQVTIDTGDASNPEIDVNSNSQDGTTVVRNEDGTYTVKALHRKYGGGRLSLLNVYVYNLGDQVVGTTGMKELAKGAYHDEGAADGEGAYKYLKSYNTSDLTTTAPDSVKKMVGFSSKQTEETTVPVVSDGAATYGVGDSDEYIALTYTNDGANAGNMMPITLTTKSADVTHVVFKYLLGHATFSMAYDLAEMAKVPEVSALLAAASSTDAASVQAAREAYDSLPFDVKPFATGLGNLEKAEGELVAAQLASLDAKDAAAVAAARAAYDKLDPAVKAQVAADAVTALENAETAIRKAADAAAKAEKDAHTVKAVKLAKASYTYTGSAFKPAVTVTAADGSKLAASAYTVAYAKNVNAGTATVTVKGKGAYSGTATAKFTIAKAAGKVTLKKATKPVKLKSLKKKAQSVAITKATVKKGEAAATYSIAKVSKSKKNFSINAKTGKITVKKGTKGGTYKVTVKATSKANANYKKASATAVITIKVK